jgi:hypothetical protein
MTTDDERLPVRRQVAHNVDIGGWRFTVHFADCTFHRRSYYRLKPVSPGMRLVVCRHCRPPEELVGPYLKTVGIYIYSHAGLGRAAAPPQRAIEAG